MKLINTATAFLVFVLFFVLVALLVNAVYPYKVVEIYNLPYPVKTPVVHAGDKLVLESEYCKLISTPASFSVSYIEHESGAITFTQETFASSLNKGCAKRYLNFSIPPDLHPGIHHVELNVRYPVNEFREVRYTFPSQRFEVINSERASDSANILWVKNYLSEWEIDENKE